MSIIIISEKTSLSYLIKQLVATIKVEVIEVEMPDLLGLNTDDKSAPEKIDLIIIDDLKQIKIIKPKKEFQDYNQLLSLGNIFDKTLEWGQHIKDFSKPVHPAKLKDSLVNMLENENHLHGQILEMGPFFLHNLGRYMMDRSKMTMVYLTKKEMEIIQYLYSCGQNGAGREEMLTAVWKITEDIDTHTVETHMYRLRQKLAASFDEDNFIVTENGIYKLHSMLLNQVLKK